jgi:4-hydroxybenzoate polyprenyltransferase
MALVSTVAPARRAVLPRLGAFVLTRFNPAVYVSYGVLWSLSLEGTVALASGESAWRPTGTSAVRTVCLVLALLFFRMLDEQKDLGYDRVHNPGRPLVTGAITAADLRTAMVVIAVLATAASLILSPLSGLAYLATLGYGLLLAAAERRWPRAGDDLLLNLAIAYPVQVVAGVYLLVSMPYHAGWRSGILLVAYAGVFLHFEFARKTSWTRSPGERLYSEVLGARTSAALALGWATVAITSLLVVCRPWHRDPTAWLPCLAVLPPAWAALRFFTHRTQTWPAVTAMLFVLIVQIALLVQAVSPDLLRELG